MIKEYLVAMRFFTTMGHFLALLILFSTVPNNIRVSLGDGVSSADELVASQTAQSALVIGIVCFLFDFTGMFFGRSLFNYATNVFQIIFHFVGSIFLSMFITQNWGYQALWPIIISCSFPPAFAEIAMFMRLHLMRIGPH